MEEEFVLTWKIEHFNLCVIEKGEFINSPEFFVDSLEKTAWFLQIYPYGNTDETCVASYLSRSSIDEGPTIVSVDFTLSLVTADGTEHMCEKWENQSFALSERIGSNYFKKRDELTKERKIFLPNDLLTVRCYIQISRRTSLALKNKKEVKSLASFLYDEKSDDELTEDLYGYADSVLKMVKKYVYSCPNACTARTKICIEKRSCLWNVINFSGLDKNKRGLLPLASVSKFTPPLLLAILLDNETKTNQCLKVEIKRMKAHYKSAIAVFCEITLMDIYGKPSELKSSKYFILKDCLIYNFPLKIRVMEIVENKNTYLQNDTLLLHLSFVFSEGSIMSQIEESYYPLKKLCSRESENMISLRNDISLLRSEQKLCDVTLIIGTEEFPAHKSILSARSPVFKAMFERDMAENKSGIVELKDLDAETLTKMLEFMYGDGLAFDKLQCDLVAKLYTASDKYQCIALREMCQFHLRSSLTVANVGDVLLLADMHTDKSLKEAAGNFILSHGIEVLSSVEWDTFMKNHSKLAAETLNCICLKFMNS